MPLRHFAVPKCRNNGTKNSNADYFACYSHSMTQFAAFSCFSEKDMLKKIANPAQSVFYFRTHGLHLNFEIWKIFFKKLLTFPRDCDIILTLRYKALYAHCIARKSVLLTQRVHPFPFRTRKLSSAVPKILAWRRAGKIGQCWHTHPVQVFCNRISRCF